MTSTKPHTASLRGCKRWRAVFDRDGSEEQCGRTTICSAAGWGLLDGPA